MAVPARFPQQDALDKILFAAEDKTVLQVSNRVVPDHSLSDSSSSFSVVRVNTRGASDTLTKVYEVFESEAKRIAHRLHDESAQMLAVVYLELGEIAKNSPAHTAERISKVVGHLDEVCLQLRSISHELRPIILDRLGLLPALRVLIEGVSKRSSLSIELSGETAGRLDSQQETVIYRAVQEALANVCRHAQASHVDVRIWRDSETAGCSVVDNGIGFKLSTGGFVEFPGLGLTGIKERARALGGECEISSRPQCGTTLQVTIPL